ncbi:MAG TPA: hypothetical protein VFE37_01000 [Chloroflexota bacterium]|nr:hypothetical protein [Chloroflexota bacterium]
MAQWADADELTDHYQAHRWDTNCATIPEYDASARATIRNGIRFTYDEKDSGRPRVGYYDPETGLLTVLRGDGSRILTHFAPDDGEDYVLRQPNSTYRPRQRDT